MAHLNLLKSSLSGFVCLVQSRSAVLAQWLPGYQSRKKITFGTGNITRLLLSLSFCLYINIGPTFGQTTTGPGNWNSTTPNAPWPGGTVPIGGANVVIAHNVTVDVNTASLNSLTVNNTLTTTPNHTVTATTITVNGIYTNGSTGAITYTTMNVNAGDTYDHTIDGGTIPTANLAVTANCKITAVTLTFAGAGGQSLTGTSGTTFNNLITGGSSSTTTSADVVVNGAFSISDGTTFSVGDDITVNGVTTIGAKLLQNADGSIVFTGTMNISGQRKICLVKTNSDGELKLQIIDVDISVT
jgi:hypothetical protein